MSEYITQTLTRQWLGSYYTNLTELENYYFGFHSDGMLTDKQRTEPKLKRFWNPVNLCGLIVDEPVGYLAEGHIKITADDEKLSDFGQHYFNKRIKGVLPELIIYQGLFNEAYLYFYPDIVGQSRGLKARVIPLIENGKPRIEPNYGGEDDEELTSAIIYYRTPIEDGFIERRVTLTLESILIEKREEKKSNWIVEDERPNTSGCIPVAPTFNAGKPDLLDIIPLQDDYNSVMYDLRSARSFHGFPMLAFDGEGVDTGPMSMTEVEITSVNGTETSRKERRRELEVGAGVYFPKRVKRIEAGDLSSILESKDAILEDMAKISSSVALMKKSSLDLSGLALRYLQQSFEAKMLGKANRLAEGIKRGLEIACKQLAADEKGTYSYEADGVQQMPTADELSKAKFTVTVTPKFPRDLEANAKVAESFYGLGGSRETSLGYFVRDPSKEIDKRKEEDNPPQENI